MQDVPGWLSPVPRKFPPHCRASRDRDSVANAVRDQSRKQDVEEGIGTDSAVHSLQLRFGGCLPLFMDIRDFPARDVGRSRDRRIRAFARGAAAVGSR